MSRPAGQPDPPPLNTAALVGIGLELVVSVVLFLFAGRWLDGWLGSEPWLMLLGALLGMAVGFYGLFRRLIPAGGQDGRSQ